MILHKLEQQGLVKLPDYIHGGTQYLVNTGSVAYGCNTEDSDLDLYGFCIPAKEIVFPHINGHIYGFGDNPERFEQWNPTITPTEEYPDKYDIQIFNIVKYFDLCLKCNPNMIDSLFVAPNLILHKTKIGDHVRRNRKLFLSKLLAIKTKSYAYSQLEKLKSKNPTGKRKELVDKFGYDPKFAYHIVRLCFQAEQLLTEGDLDLTLNKETYKSIRRGEWKFEDFDEFFNMKEPHIEKLYQEFNAIPYEKQTEPIRKLLIECLEMAYGSVDKYVKIEKDIGNLIEDIEKVLKQYRIT